MSLIEAAVDFNDSNSVCNEVAKVELCRIVGGNDYHSMAADIHRVDTIPTGTAGPGPGPVPVPEPGGPRPGRPGGAMIRHDGVRIPPSARDGAVPAPSSSTRRQASSCLRASAPATGPGTESESRLESRGG